MIQKDFQQFLQIKFKNHQSLIINKILPTKLKINKKLKIPLA